MAVMNDYFCTKCGNPYRSIGSNSDDYLKICSTCEGKIKKYKLKEHKKKLKNLTLEQRVTLLEKRLYELENESSNDVHLDMHSDLL